jgi:hypothetical protein
MPMHCIKQFLQCMLICFIQQKCCLSCLCAQGLYVEMKFEHPSRIQATTLPMILTPPYKDLIAQVCAPEREVTHVHCCVRELGACVMQLQLRPQSFAVT